MRRNCRFSSVCSGLLSVWFGTAGFVSWVGGQTVAPQAPATEKAGVPAAAQDPATAAAAGSEPRFIQEARQITFDGLRSGEGYFNKDGTQMVFQSERDPANPYYQIFLLDFQTGETRKVSPGNGMTTCAWIHPDGKRVMFASTHEDPSALEKQQRLLKQRQEGTQPRYEWNYDEFYELYEADLESGELRRLSNATGYDAEGCYSPDGSQIVFASNRNAWTRELTAREKELFEHDKAYLMDIFIMNADGTDVRQLTDSPGYDGGPFFSADGKKICWRRFSEDGARAEIFSMNVDGTDQRQLTRANHMSWAPFFHPSGEYLIFNTNKHGFDNFELYIVDAGGRSEPVRVTNTPGFDGLASFTPDGTGITWTSNRNQKQSQIFLGNWDHQAARAALGIDTAAAAAGSASQGSAGKAAGGNAAAGAPDESGDLADSREQALAVAAATDPDYRSVDLMKHVDFLCHPRLAGRMTGSPGERQATAYVAAYLDHLGLQPAGDNGTWFQEFEYPAGAELGPQNSLVANGQSLVVDQDWRPLTFSRSAVFEPADVVWAGYGIRAPAEEGQEEYDSYVHLDVKDKWVVALRYMPENISAERRQFLQYHSSLRKKAMDARDQGARGIIFVSGPTSMAREQLVPLEKDFSLAGTSIGVLSVTDDVAAAWLAAAGKDLQKLQEALDGGTPAMGFPLPGAQLAATVEIEQKTGKGRNVVGRLPAGNAPGFSAILVGAHIDHLGAGRSSNSLARDDEASSIHFGADDNASGVAAMLEIAEAMARDKREGRLKLKRDVLFAAWSGEELGLIGSQHFVGTLKAWMDEHMKAMEPARPAAGAADGTATAAREGEKPAADPGIYPVIAACINMDMVGRYNGTLILQGISSSPDWKSAAELNATIGLKLKLNDDVNLPTDASSFYRAGVPIFSAFTGSHTDYHTPRDTPDKLDYGSMARIARLMGLVARKAATSDAPPRFTEGAAAQQEQPRAVLRAYLGSIPDYSGDVTGVRLSGVTADAPADKAGVKAGDVIVELAGKKIENVYDYTYAIEALKPGQKTTIVVMRGTERLTLEVVPGRR